jgi:hypothetical protein
MSEESLSCTTCGARAVLRHERPAELVAAMRRFFVEHAHAGAGQLSVDLRADRSVDLGTGRAAPARR